MQPFLAADDTGAKKTMSSKNVYPFRVFFITVCESQCMFIVLVLVSYAGGELFPKFSSCTLPTLFEIFFFFFFFTVFRFLTIQQALLRHSILISRININLKNSIIWPRRLIYTFICLLYEKISRFYHVLHTCLAQFVVSIFVQMSATVFDIPLTNLFKSVFT